MELKANELRVGNWIYWNISEKMHYQYNDGTIKSVPHQLKAILPNTLHTVPISLGKLDKGDYIGIPLTEEWLIRFGFEKNTTSWTNWKRPNTTKEVRIGIQNKYLFYNGLEIKYVHQLQNLYFALTGEELELSPK